MNQILKSENNIKESISKNEYNKTKNHSKSNSNIIYKFQFIICSVIACIFLFAFFIRILKMKENEQLSKQLINQYNVSTLYSTNSIYSAQLVDNLSDNISNSNSTNTPFVIGMLKIDSINLNYSILSNSNKDLLDISVCRFAGPMPNEVGNLCIAGHNYVDYKFFSRLNELEINDNIKIYDLNGQMLEYSIFNKYETETTDLSCTSQNTNGNKIITLLTCNNVNGKRLIVVAKQK